MQCAVEITIAPEPADSATARWCLDQYFDLLNERSKGGYEPPTGQPIGPGDFTPPDGVFLVAQAGGKAVGCGALKSVRPGIGELKRLWVAGSMRGLGLGQRLLTALEDEARQLNMDMIRLDTNKSLTEARALYLKNGYREVPPFNDDPFPDHWFEKKLD